MSGPEPTLTDLAKRGELSALEDRWLTAIDRADLDRGDLLEALAALNDGGEGDQAAALAWTWLATEQERAGPADLLTLGRALILRCSDNDEMRGELLRLYQEVFADRPEITRLIEVSGLGGGKSIRRALRTLEIGLSLEVGGFLITRSDEQVAEVTASDAETCTYTLRTKHGRQILDADELALAYDPVEPNDFRVLVQLYPERIAPLAETDPVALVMGIVRGRGGRLDSDQLEHLLSPGVIPSDQWHKWWTKTKAALKRCPNVGLEGRSPVILTYHAEGLSIEDEIGPHWAAAETPAQRLAVIDTYFREAKARRTDPSPAMIERMHRDLLTRVDTARRASPVDAFIEALLVDRLFEGAGLADKGAAPAREILAEAADPVALLRGLADSRFYLRALAHIKELEPDNWPEVYARLLPFAPLEGCEAVAKALAEAGHIDRLIELVQQIPSDLTNHLDAVCWLWCGPSINGLKPMSPRELLPRLLNQLAELNRSESISMEVRRDGRSKIRAALSADKYTRYKEVIAGMEADLAAMMHRTIERLEGLGQAVRANLLRIIVETHPQAIAVKSRVDPWFDEGVIFGTCEGMQRREEELNHLINVKMLQNARAIGEAASHGDLSENAEYRFALEERDLLRARAARIQNELSMARLLTANDVSTDQVNIGTRVTLSSVDQQDRREITILGPWEADAEKGIYNYQAPLCAKLKGLREGDVVTLEREGSEREYRVEAIANALTEKATE